MVADTANRHFDKLYLIVFLRVNITRKLSRFIKSSFLKIIFNYLYNAIYEQIYETPQKIQSLCFFLSMILKTLTAWPYFVELTYSRLNRIGHHCV